MDPSIEAIKASDGTDNASIATIQSSRAPAASTISVDTTLGYNSSFFGSMGTPHTFVDPVTGETITVISEETCVDFRGHVDGSNLEIDEIAPGQTDLGSEAEDIVIIKPTTQWADNVAEVLEVAHEDDGALKEQAILDALGSADLSGWLPLGDEPDIVTANGNRSYSLVFNTNDLTDTVSPGMRLRTQRTVAAPTQCTSLNGTSQYYSKSSPANMTFTDDFAAGAWIKLSSYAATDMAIISRFNGTSGWSLVINNSGQIILVGWNGSSANYRQVVSYQSVPLNRWVHISAQLDMSAYTATSTTCYVMFDGVDVPAQVIQGGTNPTLLAQAGNLEVGSWNGGLKPFPGKIAQAFVSSAKITQVNVRTLMSQGLTSSLITTHNIISAYSFSNTIADLNTSNANNLTANGSAVATNADSPFGTQASGSISSTLDYAIVQSATFSTDTTLVVQVPEGCTIPTSGGVTSVVYASNKAPYGMPVQSGKWRVVREDIPSLPSTNITTSSTTVAYPGTALYLTAPIGEWKLVWEGWVEAVTSSGMVNFAAFGALYNMTTSKLIGTTLRAQNGASTNYAALMGTTSAHVSLSAATQFTFAVGANWTSSGQWYGGNAGGTTGPTSSWTISIENAYL